MRDPLPESINLQGLAAMGGKLVGFWPVTNCQRVSSLSANVLSDVLVDIRLVGSLPNASLLGHIHAELELICQRCLNRMHWIIDEPIDLRIVAKGSVPSREEQLSELLELDEHGCIDVATWIEDEIILRIPDVPKHEQTQECDPDILRRAREYEPDQDIPRVSTDNPFKILKGWKGTK